MSEIEEKLEKALPHIARRLLNELTLVCPFDTSRLVNSINVFPTKEGLIISMAEHGKFVEFGTPPHIIEPKDKNALAWGKKSGKKREFVFRKVKHPGTRPNPFIRNTIQNKLQNIIIEEMSR